MTDRSTDPKRFDPRFDPAFQPGYDARNDPAIAARNVPARAVAPAPLPPRPELMGSAPERGPTAQQRTPASALSVDQSPTPRTERELEAHRELETHRELEAHRGLETHRELEAHRELETHRGTEADDATTRGANPFVIALWAVSVLLIAGGIAVFRAIPGLDEQSSGTGTSAFVQLFGYAVLAAVLIGGGVLVAAGNLFLLAVRWRARPNGPVD